MAHKLCAITFGDLIFLLIKNKKLFLRGNSLKKIIRVLKFAKKPSEVLIKDFDSEMPKANSKISEIKGLFQNIKKNVSIDDMQKAIIRRSSQ